MGNQAEHREMLVESNRAPAHLIQLSLKINVPLRLLNNWTHVLHTKTFEGIHSLFSTHSLSYRISMDTYFHFANDRCIRTKTMIIIILPKWQYLNLEQMGIDTKSLYKQQIFLLILSLYFSLLLCIFIIKAAIGSFRFVNQSFYLLFSFTIYFLFFEWRVWWEQLMLKWIITRNHQ